MPRYSYVNGAYRRHSDAAVHIEDRGYQFADSVYEVIACIDGRLADERGHLDRLERSLKELQIAMPVPRRVLSHILREVLRRNRLSNAGIYVQISRGVAKRDFPFPAAKTKPSLVVVARPFSFDYSTAREKGIKVISVPDLRWKRVDIKTTSLLAQALAKQQAIEKGAQDAWMVDEKGFVTEASAANAWIVLKNGTVVTRPAAGNTILRGVTRTALMSLRGFRFEERAFTLKEACAAQEAFTTAATALVVPVIAIDGKIIGKGKPGPVALALQDSYRTYARGEKQRAWKA